MSLISCLVLFFACAAVHAVDYTVEVAIPAFANTQSGLSYLPPSVSTGVFGSPCDLAAAGTCKAVTSSSLQRSLVTMNVANFCVTGIAPVVQKVKRVLDAVKREKKDLWNQVGTAGMLCCRAIAGTSTFSNHAWGSAIDITINGQLDTYGDGKVQTGLTLLAPYFNAEGFYWGAGFPTEDGMHFELSRAETQKLIDAGTLSAAPSFSYSHLQSVPGCTWPAIKQTTGTVADPVAMTVQYLLKYHCQSLTPDGFFGPKSAAALQAFQTSRGLSASGITDEITWKALFNEIYDGDAGDTVSGIQQLLNAKYKTTLTVDGKFGLGTTTAVKAFQQQRGLVTNGVVDFPTFQFLVSGCTAPTPVPTPPPSTATKTPTAGQPTPTPSAVPAPTTPPVSQSQPSAINPVSASTLTATQLRCVMPRLTSAQASLYIGPLSAAMNEKQINTNLRISAFLAQIAHESGELRYWSELGNCNYLEGRKDLGNTSPGDGCKYKGRGPLQLTGKSNYKAAGTKLGVDLISNPELVAQPEQGFRTSVWYWDQRGLNKWADAGDFDAITYRVNGGYNGKASRDAYYKTAQNCLGGSSFTSNDGRVWKTIQRGASGYEVLVLQWLLAHRGFMGTAECMVDGDFGPCTEKAVRNFQLSNSLGIDGNVGPNTWSALVVTVSKDRVADGTFVKAVKALQSGLNKFNYKLTVDGVFNDATNKALQNFQDNSNLDVDGICGAGTWSAIVASAASPAQGYALAAASDDSNLVYVSETPTIDQISQTDSVLDGAQSPNDPAVNDGSSDSSTAADAKSTEFRTSKTTAIIVGAVGGPLILIAGAVVGWAFAKRSRAASNGNRL